MNWVSDIKLTEPGKTSGDDGRMTVRVGFSIQGALREAINEENWTEAYNRNDVVFKLKYDVRLVSGGFRKRTVGIPIDSYRKASIFWTRNPKLVNPMKDRRIWVQVAKNFKPFIRLTEEEVREELFDFDEGISFQASELGSGRHTISAEVQASWQKHEFIPSQSCKNSSPEIELIIN
jgi:hypothetical protein